MTLLDRFNSKLSYKLHTPIISVVIIGLVIVSINAIVSMNTLTKDKYQEVQETYQNYAKKALQTQTQIALTNAIAIANNTEIQNALQNKDRKTAQLKLNQLLQQYKAYTGFNDVKIHLHTLDMHSFLRSWRPTHFGDDLSQFRHSLHQLKATKTPFSTVELGRAGILIRGLAPIKFKGEIIGSVEFIQSFDHLINELKQSHNLNVMILGIHDQSINYFNRLTKVGKNRALLNGDRYKNEPLIKTLKDYDFDQLDKDEHLIKEDFYITAVPLHDFKQTHIGCILITNSLHNINNIINNAQHALLYQIITMLIVDVLIILILVWILQKSITRPIRQLSVQIQNMDSKIDNLEELNNHLPIEITRKDEIGVISKTVNRFIDHISTLFHDLQKSNKITEEYLKAVYAGSIVSKGNPQGIITYVNDALCDATGYTKEELIGQPHNIFRHPSTPKSTFRDMWKSIKQGNIWHGLFKNQRKDGTPFYANITVVPIQDEQGKVIEYLALRDDVTELVQSQKKLRDAFNTDALTSMGNRFKLLDDFTLLEEAYLAIVDIRSFKEINDFYGYDIGDKVIIALSNRLFNYFEEQPYEIYRLQADEFGILANGKLITQENFIKNIKNFAISLETSPLQLQEYHTDIDLTIGLSTNQQELFTEADIAHKTAKKLNKTLVIYSNDLKTSDEYKNNLLWTGRLKKAISQNRIHSFYQPIVNNQTQKIEKYEALVRLESEENEIISPFFFLDIAKKSRLYSKLTHIMIQNSFDYFARRDEQFSINLTADDMVDSELIDYLTQMLDRYQVAHRLVLEIVESESIQNFEQVERFIQLMKGRGCMIAVDDFGTGYSNFEYLLKLKPDFIKIDGSMIKNIHLDPDVYSVVETIVSFAQKNKIKTIAEFVSEKQIFDIVKALGIDYSQGYYFGEPKPKV